MNNQTDSQRCFGYGAHRLTRDMYECVENMLMAYHKCLLTTSMVP